MSVWVAYLARYGTFPPLHVANQYAQWLDWQGTGTPNNPLVWAQLQANNATMVMFEKDGNRAQDRFLFNMFVLFFYKNLKTDSKGFP